jgi:thioredoxin 1
MSDEELEKIKKAMLERMMKKPEPKSGFWNPGKVHTLNESNFSKAIQETDRPILVDFWAEWCGPCKTMTPIITQMAQEFMGTVYFAKLNVDQNPKIASQYGIMSIPNFIVFKNSKAVGQTVGAVGKSGLTRLIQAHLNS